jgi:hypothetical protein
MQLRSANLLLFDARDAVARYRRAVEQAKRDVTAEARLLVERLNQDVKEEAERLQLIMAAANRMESILQRVRSRLGNRFPEVAFTIFKGSKSLLARLQEHAASLQVDSGAVERQIDEFFSNFEKPSEVPTGAVNALESAIVQLCGLLDPSIIREEIDIALQYGNPRARILDRFDALIKRVDSQIHRLQDAVQETMQSDIQDKLHKVLGTVNDIAEIPGYIGQNIEQGIESAFNVLEELSDNCDAYLNAGGEALRKLVLDAFGRGTQQIKDIVSSVEAGIKEALESEVAKEIGAIFKVDISVENELRFFKAHGLAPITDALKANRERLSYYAQHFKQGAFQPLDDLLGITPSVALFNRFDSVLDAGALKGISLRVPTRFIGDTFKPESLQQMLPSLNLPTRLRDILPDIGGIDLAGLFEKANFPTEQFDKLKVSHGINKATKRAYAEAKLNAEMKDEMEIFSFSPLAVKIRETQFDAKVHADVGIGEPVQMKVDAQVLGDWSLAFGGNDAITFKQTKLRFDETGHLKFDLDPSKIKLHPVLNFVSDLIKSVKPDSGLAFELVEEDGFPVGARANINMPLPTLQTGAFAISNLVLRGYFELSVKKQDGFGLAIGIALAERRRPFVMTILCLGGGGWIDANARYYPFKNENRLVAEVQFSLALGAFFDFDIGIAQGGVRIFLGLALHFQYAGGGRLSFVLSIIISGEVVLLGLVSISLLISFEGRYTDGTMVCTGLLEARVKIGWFIDIKVRKQVQFEMGRGGGLPASIDFDGPGANRIATKEVIERNVDLYFDLLEFQV